MLIFIDEKFCGIDEEEFKGQLNMATPEKLNSEEVLA